MLGSGVIRKPLPLIISLVRWYKLWCDMKISNLCYDHTTGVWIVSVRKHYVKTRAAFLPTVTYWRTVDHRTSLRWNLFPVGSLDHQPLHWRHNGHDSVSNHQSYYCLLNCLFRRRSKIISKLCVTGLCAGNSPETGEFPTQMASNAENVSIWWRHHEYTHSVLQELSTRVVFVVAWFLSMYVIVTSPALGQSYG